jgi:hypothetical protein
MTRPLPTCFLLAALCVAGAAAHAQDPSAPVQLTLKDHRFTPDEIHLPAAQRMTIEVTNSDATADEFEMRQLAIEKIVPAGSTALVRLRPLGPGRYQFIGEFHEATAHGTIVVDPPGAPAAK